MHNETDTQSPLKYVDVGRRIESAMVGKFTPPRLAKALGISPQAVGKWLLGEVLPVPENAKAIQALTGLDVGTLYGGHEPPRPGRRSPDTTRATISRPMVGVTVPDKYLHPMDGAPNQFDDLIPSRTVSGRLRDRVNQHMKDRETSRAIERELLRRLSIRCNRLSGPAPVDAVAEYRVRNGYFDQVLDIAVLRAGIPVAAVDFMGDVEGQIETLVGRCVAWSAATGGKPFYLVLAASPMVKENPRYARNIESLNILGGRVSSPLPVLLSGFFEIDPQNPEPGFAEFERHMAEEIATLTS